MIVRIVIISLNVSRLYIIVIWQDIDGVFGVLSQFILKQPLYTPKAFMQAMVDAFASKENVVVIPVFAIFDYKAFYDPCIDKHIKIRKEVGIGHSSTDILHFISYLNIIIVMFFICYSTQEEANLGWRIDAIQPHQEDEAARVGTLTATNYRKYAQNASIDMLPISPVYQSLFEDDEMCQALTFMPRIILPKWMPLQCEISPQLGESFLVTVPKGWPQPQALQVWKEYHSLDGPFMRAVRKKFNRLDEIHIIKAWEYYLMHEMPPTDDVLDYAIKMQSEFVPPLWQYLYGDAPEKFPPMSTSSSSSSSCSSLTPRFEADMDGPMSSFVNQYGIKATVLDIKLAEVCEQYMRTVPSRTNRIDHYPWEFVGYPEHLHKIHMERGTGTNRRMLTGIVCARRKQNHEAPSMLMISFVDKSAPTEITMQEYFTYRMAYLALYDDEESDSDVRLFSAVEKEALAKERTKKQGEAALLKQQRDQERVRQQEAAAARKANRVGGAKPAAKRAKKNAPVVAAVVSQVVQACIKTFVYPDQPLTTIIHR